MEEILDRGREDASGPTGASSENASEQATEGGSGLRTASVAVAVVSAAVLVGGGAGMLAGGGAGMLAGGGAGMLAGVALGAINPFALGMMGVVVGIGLPVLLTSVVGARRRSVRRPWWRRTFGG